MSLGDIYALLIERFAIAAARKSAVVSVCCAAVFSSVAVSQESARSETEQTPTATTADEEVVVRGRSLTFYRAEIERAEEAIYDRFNEINSNDDYDIHCRTYRVTGSKIPQRICQPNFWREQDANIGEETARAMQGGLAFNAGMFRGRQHYQRGLMNDEFRKLAQEDQAFREALVNLVNLERNYESYRESSRNSRRSD